MIEFISQEGTKYIWDPIDNIVDLTPHELRYSQIKIRLMSDRTILNQVSGNNIQMGIPLQVSPERLREVKRYYRRLLIEEPNINIESHAIDRLIEDTLIPDEDPSKRGWIDENDIRECVRSMYQIIGLRLNVNHYHSLNTKDIKYLHPQFAITIKGKRSDGEGRVVTAVLDKSNITVITIL
jgi:hypothetical protein